MKKMILITALLVISPLTVTAEPVSLADALPEADRNQMYNIITEYNKCMMTSQLQPSQNGKAAQADAQKIMDGCETHLDSLKSLLTENDVNPALVEGMSKQVRSKGARHLMSRAMNNMAAQAAAMHNAETMQSDTE